MAKMGRARTTTMSRFGPSGSLMKKKVTREQARERIARRGRVNFGSGVCVMCNFLE
jgi:hypothetical protein